MANVIVLNLRVSRTIDEKAMDLAVEMTKSRNKLNTKSDIYRRAIEYGLPVVQRETAGLVVENDVKFSYSEKMARIAAKLVQKGLAANDAEIEALMAGYAEN